MTISPSRPTGEELPRVAVIVPIYNVDQYLDECLESIANQTIFAEMEVFLVDDGSSDRSPEIASDFAQRHDNVTFLVQRNSGPGAARNRALQQVTAPLVTFCDSDDLLPPDAYETLRRILIDEDADVAVGRMQTFPNRINYPWLEPLGGATVLEGIENAEKLILSAGPCNKVFRMDMLRRENLNFCEQGHFEDVYVTLPVLLLANRIAVTSQNVYHYRQRVAANSIMNSLFTREQNFWDHLAVEEFLADFRSRVPGIRRHVLDFFMVRSFQGFAVRAPRVMDEPELRRYFDRSVAVYRHTSPEVFRRACLNTHHRAAMVSLLLGDWDLFADSDAAITDLGAVDGRLSLRLAQDPPEVVQSLLVVDRSSSHVESIDYDRERDVLRIAGRFAVDGLPQLSPVPCGLSVRVRGSGITQPALNFSRRIVERGIPSDRWSQFSCEIPTRQLKEGNHQLRLVFDTPTGQASMYMRANTGALNGARTLYTKSGRVLLRKDRDAATLQVQVGTGPEARKRWRRSLVLEDMKHVVKRKPLWKPRLARLLTGWMFRTPVWLIGERRDTAQDNGAMLFEHLRRERSDVTAYYLIDKDSPHYSRVKGLGRVVPHSSLRHRLLMLHAAVLVNAYDINSYMLPDGWRPGVFLEHLAWRIGSRRVFLQHGVTWHNVSHALHKGVTGVDLFVATAEQEADAARTTMGYKEHEVALTGFPRFDRLHRGPVGRRILVMPTWRTYLVRPSYRSNPEVLASFERSDFAVFWRAFLNDPSLLEALEDSDTTLEFFGHYELAESLRSLAPVHDKVVVSHHGTRSVQESILDASLLMTDWSSTFFDAAYAGRPVILAPFDEEEFRAKHYARGYADADDLGFGPVVRTVDEAVAAVTRYIATGFSREPEYARRVEAFFAHRDTSNSERVVEAILGMMRGRPAVSRAASPLQPAESTLASGGA